MFVCFLDIIPAFLSPAGPTKVIEHGASDPNSALIQALILQCGNFCSKKQSWKQQKSVVSFVPWRKSMGQQHCYSWAGLLVAFTICEELRVRRAAIKSNIWKCAVCCMRNNFTSLKWFWQTNLCGFLCKIIVRDIEVQITNTNIKFILKEISIKPRVPWGPQRKEQWSRA